MQAPKKFTNKLVDESSPYLLQHAHNPVDWYPWGEEAFERARAEDKPVLVSIGYSACHWCHVMEHESFEDEAVAAIQNEHFINIKVDMEERPDVDQIYMNFVQMTTGSGGWPMNVFITPDKVPFFGGTYFPPQPAFRMPAWSQVLQSIAEASVERREELLQSANEVLGELRRLAVVGEAATAVEPDLCEHAFKALRSNFDAKNGGFGGAPKFPPSMTLEFLLRYWKRTADPAALAIVRKTAETMAYGGIHDQLGGGFHRYTVDAIWLVPHFEKMLYDNAQLVRVYLHMHQIARSGHAEAGSAERYKKAAVDTLEYVLREMTDAGGGFYSSQDADSEGVEGKFFVWTREEIAAVLGDADAREFCELFDITEGGNFEHKNIPNIRGGIAGDLGGSPDKNGGLLDDPRVEAWKQKLFDAREQRIKPFRDEKVLTAWNGLMLAAFAEAAAVLDEPRYLEAAIKNADFLLKELRPDGSLLRSWKDGRAKLNAYIEDHANLADGLIELYQASGRSEYLDAAREIAEGMITEFWDEDEGGFFFTSKGHEELIVRSKDLIDNASPSGNSVAADVLLRLAKFYGDDRLARFGRTVLRLAAKQARRFPSAFGRMLATVEFELGVVREIAIVGDSDELVREVMADYRPLKIVAKGGNVPLLEGRESVGGSPAAYVCENFVCQRPVTTVEGLRELL